MTAEELFDKTDRKSFKVYLDRRYNLTSFLDQLAYIYLYQTLGEESNEFVAQNHTWVESLKDDATIVWRLTEDGFRPFSEDIWSNTSANTIKFPL